MDTKGSDMARMSKEESDKLFGEYKDYIKSVVRENMAKGLPYSLQELDSQIMRFSDFLKQRKGK